MSRVYLALLFLYIYSSGIGQTRNQHVEVYGKILSKKDSSEISASLFYEKLPYYDDMGMAKSNSEGIYKFYLINDTKYNFKITKGGFVEYIEEYAVVDEDGDGAVEYNMYIEPEAEPELITLEDLIFSRGSDRITESSYEELNELVLWLNERPNMIIQLEGHTDFAGNADANMRLSQARVEAVKDYLIKQGIKSNRVLTKAFGGTQPLFTERTDEAKAKNRRVEVRVLRK